MVGILCQALDRGLELCDYAARTYNLRRVWEKLNLFSRVRLLRPQAKQKLWMRKSLEGSEVCVMPVAVLYVLTQFGGPGGGGGFHLGSTMISNPHPRMFLIRPVPIESGTERINVHRNTKAIENLYRTARELLDVFRAVIPASLGNDIESSPRTAAVFHNDCVFLAHQCSSLALEYKETFRSKDDKQLLLQS